MNTAPQRRKNAYPPVTKLISNTLDHDRAIIWDFGSGQLLIDEKSQHILCGLRVEIMLLYQFCDGGTARHSAQLAHQRTNATAELDGPARSIPMPERHLAGLAGSGGSRERDHG